MAYKQVIVVNKGLNMSKGKMAAQVSHASMAFLTHGFYDGSRKVVPSLDDKGNIVGYKAEMFFDRDLYEEWLCGIFRKVILEVKSELKLQKVVEKAKEFGMVENVDFFCIRDACFTELEPDETGSRWTCIGFKPMSAERIDVVTTKLQLFKE